MATVETEARVATILPRDLREGLERLARENERTLSGEFRVAIREQLERHAVGAAERADGLARWHPMSSRDPDTAGHSVAAAGVQAPEWPRVPRL